MTAASSSVCGDCGAFDPFTLDGRGHLFCVHCGVTVKGPPGEMSPASRHDSDSTATDGAPAVRGGAAGSYAPHGKTQTSTCGVGASGPAECGIGLGDLNALVCTGCPHDTMPVRLPSLAELDRFPVPAKATAPRCERPGHPVTCRGGHLSPVDFTKLPALRRLPDGSLRLPDGSPPVVIDTMDDDDRPEPFDPPRFVHAVELENLTGLASVKLTHRLRVDTRTGRATLIVRVGVAS